MPSTVNIGTLEGLLRWKADDAELNRSLDSVAKKADVSRSQLNKYNKQLDSVTSNYARVVAAIDPVAANTQKYEKAERALVAALKAGIITQDQHNRTLAQAKEKYLGAHASTLTWREEMQRLTNVVTPFASRLANVSVLIRDLTGALGASTSAMGATSAASASATASIASISATLVPLLPLLAALALAFGEVYVAAKVFSFLKGAVSEGVQTQLIIERLNNTLKSTGAYAQLSSAQLVTLAESYELLSGKSKEEIIAAETVLARFDSLNSKSYPEALRLTLAYAKAMGVTADVAASKLGPAYDGNIRSVGALKEAGIVLTAAQKKTLQGMIDAGKEAEYQTLLFSILREKVGELSSEYDMNLSRQVARAKIVLDDFGESIANEVIPAIEDAIQSIVNSLGGWDSLKKTVNEVGGAIGDFIRTSIYGLMIGLHELGTAIDSVRVALSYLKEPTVLIPFIHLNTDFKEIRKTGDAAAKSAANHASEILRLTAAMSVHRTALEGNTTVYQNNGRALDNIIGKNERFAKLMDELSGIYEDQTANLERIFQLRTLAASGAGSLNPEKRRAEEEKINQAYKDRIDFLKLEEKYGSQIATHLMESKKQLRDFELKAKVELELATQLRPIDLTSTIKGMFDRVKVNDSGLGSIVENEKKNQEAFKQSGEAYNKWVEDLASGWKERFVTMRSSAEKEMDGIKQAVNLGLLDAEEGERALAQVRADLYSSQVDKFSSMASQFAGILSQLGGKIGSFFAQLARVADSVQNVNSTANSLGGWSSMAGAWGGVLAAYAAVYSYADSMIEKSKSLRYGTRGSIGITGGTEVPSYIKKEGLALTQQMSAVLKAFEDQLRISVTDLANIEIRVRNNGKEIQAWIGGIYYDTFTSVDDAIRGALLKALSDPSSGFRGMTDIMSQGLAKWTSPDMEGLLTFLTTLREISDLSLSPLVIDLQKSMVHFNEMREALNGLDQSMQSTIDAQLELTDTQNRLIQQTKDQLLGIDTSAAEAVRNLAGFNRGMMEVSDTAKKGLESALAAAQGRLKEIERLATGLPNGGQGGQGVSGPVDPGVTPPGLLGVKLFDAVISQFDDEKARLQKAIEEYTKQLGEIPKALTDQEIDLGIYAAIGNEMRKTGKYAKEIAELEQMKVVAQYEALRLSLVAAGAWERWAGIWQDLYNQAMTDAGTLGGKRPRGSGHGSDKDSVRDYIKDTTFNLSLVGLTDYQKGVKELDHQYEDLFKQAGKDKKLKEELMALKEKELAQLRTEQKESTLGKFRDFMGLVTPFDKVRKTSIDLIKEIQGSPFGNAQKAAMIGRVMVEVDKQITRMSKEMEVSLFGQMLSDMQKFGATEEQMAGARRAMAILEHELKMADFAITIAQLEAEGKVSKENLDIIHTAYDFLAGIDPTKFILPTTTPDIANDNFGGYSGGATDTWTDKLKAVQDTLEEWARIPLSDSLAKAHEMTDSFDKLMKDVQELLPLGWNYTEQAQKAFRAMVDDFIDDTLSEFEQSGSDLENQLKGIGDKFKDINAAIIHLGGTQEDLERAEKARLNAVSQALAQYLDPLKARREARQFGDKSILSGEQQFLNAQEKFREIADQIKSGDLTHLGDVGSYADQYEELLKGFTGGEGLRFGLKEIDDALLSIEKLVPDFADKMADIGTDENPMIVNNADMIKAIQDNEKSVNTGNVLMLEKLSDSVQQLKDQNAHLSNLEVALQQGINVRNVA